MKNTNKKTFGINLGWESKPARTKKSSIKAYMDRQIAIQPSNPTQPVKNTIKK